MLAMYSFITFYHICVFLLEIYFPLIANKLEQIQFKSSQISVILNIKKTTEQLERKMPTLKLIEKPLQISMVFFQTRAGSGRRRENVSLN